MYFPQTGFHKLSIGFNLVRKCSAEMEFQIIDSRIQFSPENVTAEVELDKMAGWPDEFVTKSPKLNATHFLSKLLHNVNRGIKNMADFRKF
jgi:hypothetical protein